MFGFSANKFDWMASNSAPKNYPVELISGVFYYHNDNSGDGNPVPGNIVSSGWGVSSSLQVVGEDLKPLPDRLTIRYYSFLENTFYEGQFNLPYEKILKLFKQGSKESPAYRYLVAGMAPGGSVAVWAVGQNKRTEVFFGAAQKADLSWNMISGFEKSTPERFADYVKKNIERYVAPSVLEKIQKQGLDLNQWSRFRTPYHWSPYFIQGINVVDFGIRFFNGEVLWTSYPFAKSLIEETRPIPSGLTFSYQFNGTGTQYLTLANFDEAEIFSAFEKLGKDLPIVLEIEPKVPHEMSIARLRNEKESITLTKTVFSL